METTPINSITLSCQTTTGAVRSALGNPSWLRTLVWHKRIEDDAEGHPRYAVCYKIDPQQLPDDLENRIAAAAPIVEDWLGICLAI